MAGCPVEIALNLELPDLRAQIVDHLLRILDPTPLAP